MRLEPSLAGMDVESGDLARAAVRVSNVLMSDPELPEAHEIRRALPITRAAAGTSSR